MTLSLDSLLVFVLLQVYDQKERSFVFVVFRKNLNEKYLFKLRNIFE